jgi:ribonuclease HII
MKASFSDNIFAACNPQTSLKNSEYETIVRQLGYNLPAGVDEAGRGPLAGPVVAAACILPEGYQLCGLNDSKKLSEKKRESLYEALMNDSRVSYGIAFVDIDQIDEMNILQATLYAMKKAVENLPTAPSCLLVDGNQLPDIDITAYPIVKGDSLVLSIAAASILAKVTRDRHMKEMDAQFPEYGFLSHKGYGTKQHVDALKAFGPSPIHRKSFEPIKSMLLTKVH